MVTQSPDHPAVATGMRLSGPYFSAIFAPNGQVRASGLIRIAWLTNPLFNLPTWSFAPFSERIPHEMSFVASRYRICHCPGRSSIRSRRDSENRQRQRLHGLPPSRERSPRSAGFKPYRAGMAGYCGALQKRKRRTAATHRHGHDRLQPILDRHQSLQKPLGRVSQWSLHAVPPLGHYRTRCRAADRLDPGTGRLPLTLGNDA